MLAVCNQCGRSFETTMEDAFTPGTMCPSCHLAMRPAVFMWEVNGRLYAYRLDAERAALDAAGVATGWVQWTDNPHPDGGDVGELYTVAQIHAGDEE